VIWPYLVSVSILALAQIFGEDLGAQLDILKKFASQVEEIQGSVEAGVEQHDAEQIRFHAHKLKSSARTVGANDLADLCLALETAARITDWVEMDKLATNMRPAVARVRDYIASL